MTTEFDAFYENPNYIQYKRLLFNYLLRKRIILRHLGRSEGPALDIGSGIAPMFPLSPQVLLSDMSVTGMRIMSRDGYRCAVLDIQHLGLRSGSMRTVICSEVLEHIPDDEIALSELARVLAPAGRLIVTVPLHAYFWSKDDRIVGHCRRYDPSGLVRKIERAGLEIRKVRKVGSIAERVLTISSVLVFLKLHRGGSGWRRPPGRWFGAANRVTARALEIFALVSPLATSSIGLFDCVKPGGDRVTR